MLGLLWLLLHRTRWGMLVRAATLDREMVAALGVDQRLLFTSVFALGAGLAGLGGALSLPNASANLAIDLSVITDAFVVVVVGGMGSLPGAFLASAAASACCRPSASCWCPRSRWCWSSWSWRWCWSSAPDGLLGRPQTEARGTAGLAAPVVRAGPAARCACSGPRRCCWPRSRPSLAGRLLP